MKANRILSLVMALLLSLTICCTIAFAAPTQEDVPDTDSESITTMVDEDTADEASAQEEDTPFGRSYMVKGVVIVGLGVIFYAAIVIKSKKGKR